MCTLQIPQDENQAVEKGRIIILLPLLDQSN